LRPGPWPSLAKPMARALFVAGPGPNGLGPMSGGILRRGVGPEAWGGGPKDNVMQYDIKLYDII